jgi:hypothetical protein
MKKPRIFISHSNRDKDALSFLDLISSELNNKGFDVLVDRERLKAGANWRDEIYTWMGLCNGAVILLSEKVFNPDSLWVPRETSILLWRRTLDPNFLIVPVFMDSVSDQHLDTGNFKDLNLREIEAILQDEPDDMVRQISKRLEGLKCEASTPLEELSSQVVSLMGGLDESVIRTAADILNIELGPWDPADDPRRALALRLLQVNLKQSADVLEYLVTHMEHETNANRILSIIAPSWVDLCSARWITHCAQSKDIKPIVVLNASRKTTADMYIQRASCRTQKAMWPVIILSGVFGEAAVSEILSEINQALIQEFRLVEDPFGDNVDKRLKDLLKNRDKQGKPVFLLMRYHSSLKKIMSELHAALPWITLFVLTGDELPDISDFEPTPLRLLEPLLQPGVEEEAQNDYDYAVSVLRP